MSNHNTSTAKQYQLPQWMWLVPILLLSFMLAVPNYLRDSLWLDEVLTHRYTGTGLAEPISIIESFQIIVYDRTPPLYYIMVMGWSKIMGTAQFTDFALPTFIGLIAIAMMFQLGKLLFDTQSGIIASLLLTTSAFFIHYSHENRTYTLFILVVYQKDFDGQAKMWHPYRKKIR